MTRLKVKDVPGLFRDSNSKAIISDDKQAYERYITEKRLREKMASNEEEVKSLREEIAELKQLLHHLINSNK
jgi:hypothetical protein